MAESLDGLIVHFYEKHRDALLERTRLSATENLGSWVATELEGLGGEAPGARRPAPPEFMRPLLQGQAFPSHFGAPQAGVGPAQLFYPPPVPVQFVRQAPPPPAQLQLPLTPVAPVFAIRPEVPTAPTWPLRLPPPPSGAVWGQPQAAGEPPVLILPMPGPAPGPTPRPPPAQSARLDAGQPVLRRLFPERPSAPGDGAGDFIL
jgi:hypothetical protein